MVGILGLIEGGTRMFRRFLVGFSRIYRQPPDAGIWSIEQEQE
jgi:hypothetical protein